MPHIARFAIDDLESLSRAIRSIGAGAASMQEAARRITDLLYDELRRDDGEPDCLTVLAHKTHRFKTLPPRLQDLARSVEPFVDDDTVCLVRLSQSGYAADDADARSLVQPLTQGAFDRQPVLIGMLLAMGLDVDSVLEPDRAISMAIHHRSLDQFHVPDLLESEWFTDEETRAQLQSLGVRSLLGLGGGLPTGDLFFVFLFSYETIPDRSADLMRSLATAMKACLIPFTPRPFAEG